MSDKDGGPAFPRTCTSHNGDLHWSDGGMTLWDYFAAAAITGDLAEQSIETGEWTPGCFPSLAERAAGIADAMIAEREKRGIGT